MRQWQAESMMIIKWKASNNNNNNNNNNILVFQCLFISFLEVLNNMQQNAILSFFLK